MAPAVVGATALDRPRALRQPFSHSEVQVEPAGAIKAPQLWTLSRRFCCGPKTGSAGRNCRGERAGHRLAAEELHMVLLVRGPADEFVEVFRVESTVALAHDP